MAVFGTNKFTLVDAAKRLDPDGTYSQIAEVLNQSNPIFQDMPFFPSNAPRGNRVTFRTGLPQVGWTSLNKGIQASKSDVTSRMDTIGMLEGRSEVDRRHRGLSMSPEAYLAYRWDEDQTFLEAMSQEAARTLLFGSELTTAEAFTGFLPRLASASDPIFGESLTLAINATEKSTVTSTASSASVTPEYESILIVDWGERYCHGIYPYNTPAGLTKENHENESVTDASGGKYYADVSTFSLSMGLTVKNPKHVHAIRNILRKTITYSSNICQGLDALTSDSARPAKGGSGVGFPDIIGLLIRAMNAMDPCTNGQRVIYCSKQMLTSLEFLARNTHNMMLNFAEWDGKPVTTFRGVPIRGVDLMDTVSSEV